MAEPVTPVAATVFVVGKAWSILAGVCGSLIPILALSDKTKLSFKNACFMAVTGSSFAIFVGPWFASYTHITSVEGVIALSWTMGAIGVYLIRTVLNWLDKRGIVALDRLTNRVIDTIPTAREREGTRIEIDENINTNQRVEVGNQEGELQDNKGSP